MVPCIRCALLPAAASRTLRNCLLGALMTLAIFGIGVASAQQPPGPYYGPHMWNGAGWMFFGPLMMILFVAAIIVVAVLIVRWLGGMGQNIPPHRPASKTPLDILKERFARGEIDKEEFDQRRRVLED